MNNKTARVLAIIALVFMAIFIVTLTMTIIDYKMLHGSIGYVALSSGVLVLVIFLALRADGRGVSITKMNNEPEMQKMEKELEQQNAKAEEPAADTEKSDAPPDSAPPQNPADEKTDGSESPSDATKTSSDDGTPDE